MTGSKILVRIKRSTFYLILPLISALLLNGNAAAKRIETVGQLTDSLEKLMENRHIPGMFLTMTTADSVIFEGGIGKANLEENKPVTADTRFLMGSITKSFVALGILKLVDEGKLSLQDNIRDIVPDVPFENPWAETAPVKVIHLLEHTAGFDDMHFNELYNITDDPDMPLSEVVRVNPNSLKVKWKPGTRHAYANPGYSVAGYIIEKITGQTYAQYIQKVVLQPLEMNQSEFITGLNGKTNYATGYTYTFGSYEPVTFYPIYHRPAGNLASCAKDMTEFVQFFLNHGYKDSLPLFPSSTIDQMETPSASLAAQAGLKTGYGLANYLSHFGNRFHFHGHDGGIDGFISFYGYNRDLGVGYAISVNNMTSAGSIKSLIVDFLTRKFEKKQPKTIALNKKAIEEYTGYYTLKSSRNELFSFIDDLLGGAEILIKNDSLYLKSFAKPPQLLLPVRENIFMKAKENAPSVIFMKNGTTKAMATIGGRSYYEQTGFTKTLWLRVLVLGAVIMIFLNIIMTFLWLLMLLFKKLQFKDFLYRLPPFIAVSGLITVVAVLSFGFNTYLHVGSFNLKTGAIYAGTWIFFIFSVISLFNTLRKMRSNNGITQWYLLLTGIFLTSFSIYLYSNNLIGLQLWSY